MDTTANDAIIAHLAWIERQARKSARLHHDHVIDWEDCRDAAVQRLLESWPPEEQKAGSKITLKHWVQNTTRFALQRFYQDSGAIRVPANVVCALTVATKEQTAKQAGQENKSFEQRTKELLAETETEPEPEPVANARRARDVRDFRAQRESVSCETTTQYDASDDADCRRGPATPRSFNPARECAAREAWENLLGKLTSQEAEIVTKHAEGTPLSGVARELDLPRTVCQAALMKARQILEA